MRTITRFNHLQELLVLIVRTIPLLKTILLMLFILSVIYGAVGIQLWQGIMRRRCFNVETGQRFGNLLPFYGFERTCTLQVREKREKRLCCAPAECRVRGLSPRASSPARRGTPASHKSIRTLTWGLTTTYAPAPFSCRVSE